jgi:pimeloyl-ACP methyl ester carboxylesterase
MARRRPKGVFEIGWASFESAASGRFEHVPTSQLYDQTLVQRITFKSGGPHGWTLSALSTPRPRPPPWKIVVITGAPSWAEYWAPVLAHLPQDREMLVVDRPGFAASQPVDYVGDIRVQAEALMPALRTAPGQRLLLVGQSYGAAISTLMAARRPPRLEGLVLLSGYLGDPGPTARWLVRFGRRVLTLIPRDLRNAVMEVGEQPPQLVHMHQALSRVSTDVHVIHGDKDDFAPIAAAQRLAEGARTLRPIRFKSVSGANHFLNDGPPAKLLAELEACLPKSETPHLAFGKWAQRALHDVRHSLIDFARDRRLIDD